MKISLAVAVYNEEENIKIFYNKVRNFNEFKNYTVEIVFVNDGSTDNIEQVINELCKADSLVKLINFSRNFSKEPAILAGILNSQGDIVIPMDVDLQDPIEVISELIAKQKEGFDVVIAKRANRPPESIIRKVFTYIFYKLYDKISFVKIGKDVGEFRLMTRIVVESVKYLPENQLFARGMLSWVGFKTTSIEFAKPSRTIGVSNFTMPKLLQLALDAITSFSVFPLRIGFFVGVATVLLALLLNSSGFFKIIVLAVFNKLASSISIVLDHSSNLLCSSVSIFIIFCF